MKELVAGALVGLCVMLWWGVFDAINRIGTGSRGDWTAEYAIQGLVVTIIYTLIAVAAIKAAADD